MPTQLDRALNSKVCLDDSSWTHVSNAYPDASSFRTSSSVSQVSSLLPLLGPSSAVTSFPNNQTLLAVSFKPLSYDEAYTKLITEPENWSEDEMRRWLNKASIQHTAGDGGTNHVMQRNLMAGSSATREELLARVKANMRAPQV